MARRVRWLGGIEEPVASPAGSEEPRPRCDAGPFDGVVEGGRGAREAVEGGGRRAGIGKGAIADDAMVLLRVEEDVAQDVARLRRRAEIAAVVALFPESSFAT